MSPASQTWLFLGPEIGQKEEAIGRIRKKLSAGGSFEESSCYAGDIPVPSIVSNMRNGSLFADKKLFLIKNADALKKKEDIDLLSSYTASPPDGSYLILISEETNVAKGLEKHIPPANKQIFWELRDSQKTEWVRTFFREQGFRISPGGVETILEMVENNTAALRQECSRLLPFLDKEKELSGEEAGDWLSHTREESAFTLFTRIAEGDLARSLESIRVLLAAKESPPAIFGGLASCFRKLLAYLALKDSGIGDDAEYRKIGVSAPGAKRDYGAAGRRFDSAAAESCLALTAEYDMRLRSAGSFPDHILMDEYLLKIHRLGDPPGRRQYA